MTFYYWGDKNKQTNITVFVTCVVAMYPLSYKRFTEEQAFTRFGGRISGEYTVFAVEIVLWNWWKNSPLSLGRLQHPYFLGLFGPRFLPVRPASCSFLPNISSLAKNNKSFSRLRINKTCKTIPKETDGLPFSNEERVGREMPARSDTWIHRQSHAQSC